MSVGMEAEIEKLALTPNSKAAPTGPHELESIPEAQRRPPRRKVCVDLFPDPERNQEPGTDSAAQESKVQAEPEPAKMDPFDPAFRKLVNRQANALEDSFFAAQFLEAFRLQDNTTLMAARLLFLRTIEQADATDPIEKMLIRQLIAAHHMVGEMYAEAAAAKTIDHELAYQKAAARLLGTISQLVSSLATHRKSLRTHRRNKRGPAKEAKDSGAQSGK
jgi:hypothetical protein